MEKINNLLVLICITAIIISCAKKDSSTPNTSTSTTSTVANGSINVGSETLSGIYASSCTSTFVDLFISLGAMPSDSKSYKTVYVVTGDTTFSDETYLYSDTSCRSNTMIMKDGLDNLTVGDASGSNYKVTYKETSYKMTANSATAETFYEALFQAQAGVTIDLTVGEEYIGSGNGHNYLNLWNVTSTFLKTGSESTSAYPSDINSTEHTKQ